MQEEAIKRIEKTIEMYQVQLANLEKLFGRNSKGNKLKRKLEKEIRLFNYILKKVKKEEWKLKYIKEDLEVMLRNHLKNEAKITEIELKEEEYEERLCYAGTVFKDTKESVIEGMQLQGQVLSDIPRSITNKTSDKTLNTVINYNREMNHINKEDREDLKRRIERLKKDKEILDKKVVRVKNLLNQLSGEEEFIVKEYYMRKSKWDYVANEYYEEFQKPKSINQLLNIRDNALKSMLDILNTGLDWKIVIKLW